MTPRTISAAIHHVADEVHHVLVRSAQPILQRHEIGPHILSGARDEPKHLRNAPQHFHLCGTSRGGLFFVAAQLFEQGHRPTGRLAHVEVSKLGEFDHFGGGHQANHGIAGFAAGSQRLQYWQKVIFKEEHARHHDVGGCDVCVAARSCCLIASVLRCSMH